MGTKMEMVVCKHAVQSMSHVGRCRSISRVRCGYTNYTRSHHHPGAQLWVGSSRNQSVFLERP